jgi:Flp pilus assembly protein TadG
VKLRHARWRRSAAWLRDQRGVSSIEFAILAPMVFVIMLGTFEIALDMVVDSSVQLAAQAASRAGLTTTAPSSGSRADQAKQIAMSYLTGWTRIGGTVAITETAYSTYSAVGTSTNTNGLGGLGDVVTYNISVTMKGFSGIPWLFGMKTMTYSRNYLVQNEK